MQIFDDFTLRDKTIYNGQTIHHKILQIVAQIATF